MHTTTWMIYLIHIAFTVKIILFLILPLLLLYTGAYVICCKCGSWRCKIRKTILISLSVLVMGIFLLIPDKQTLYIMFGAEIATDIVKSEKVVDLLN